MIHNSGWLIEGELVGSGAPAYHDELDWLWKQSIRAIITLTKSSLRRATLLLHKLDILEFTYKHIPIVDGRAPSQEQVDQLILWAR